MRKTRFMSLLFLVWAIAFFFLPDFRQGLEESVLVSDLWSNTNLLLRLGALPEERLKEAAQEAEQRGDARTLAFVAMHSPFEARETLRLAELAVKLDPKLKVIYPKVYFRLLNRGKSSAETREVVARWEAADPDNAFPYLMEATEITNERASNFPPAFALDKLEKETEWRHAMEKAFGAPRYDPYTIERFELNRSWLRESNLLTPMRMVLIEAAEPFPNLLNINTYSDLLLKKFEKDAETANHLPEAMGYAWEVAHMGERLARSHGSLIEMLIGFHLQQSGYKALVPLLRRAGQADAAASLESELAGIQDRIDILRGNDPLIQTSNYTWAALLVHIFAGLVVIFGLFTLIVVIYVNAKRWIRVEKRGRLFQFLTTAENYAPILFFGACVGFYISYYPYAQNFHHYMTATGPIHDFEPLFYNTLPLFDMLPGRNQLPLANPFTPYAWYAVVALAVGVLFQIPWRRKA